MVNEQAGQAKDTKFIPPYVSWSTLMGLINRLGKGPMPPRIDKGYLDNYSGSTQSVLLSTLRTLGLISEDGTVTPELRQMATDEDARVAHARQFLERLYPEQIELAKKNATSQQL